MMSVRNATLIALALALPAAGCGDDESPSTPDGGSRVDAAPIDDPDAAPDDPDAAPDDPDAAPTEPDAADPTIDPTPRVTPLSTTFADGLFGATFGPDGNLYATGFVARGPDAISDRAFVLVRFLPTGELDTSFGDDGLAIKNVKVGVNGESARGIVVQSDGRIVISGTVEHDPSAAGVLLNDRDIALVRFNANGTVDAKFGDDGVALLNLNDGIVTTNAAGNQVMTGADAPWSLSLAADDKLVLHGAQRGEGFIEGGSDPRTDTDWFTVRLTADGDLDETFSGDGKFTLDLQRANSSARAALVLADDSIVAAGYSNTPGLGSTQPVVYKLTPAGELDTSFGTQGVFHQVVLGSAAEVYNMALQGDKLVTIGYGRQVSTEPQGWVSVRLNADGTLDTTWGDEGIIFLNNLGFNDQGRNVVALPGGNTMLIGQSRVNADNSNASAVVLDTNGDPVTAFGEGGRRTFELGGNGDVFWSANVTPSGRHVAIVGIKGATAPASAENNDDAVITMLPATF